MGSAGALLYTSLGSRTVKFKWIFLLVALAWLLVWEWNTNSFKTCTHTFFKENHSFTESWTVEAGEVCKQ